MADGFGARVCQPVVTHEKDDTSAAAADDESAQQLVWLLGAEEAPVRMIGLGAVLGLAGHAEGRQQLLRGGQCVSRLVGVLAHPASVADALTALLKLSAEDEGAAQAAAAGVATATLNLLPSLDAHAAALAAALLANVTRHEGAAGEVEGRVGEVVSLLLSGSGGGGAAGAVAPAAPAPVLDVDVATAGGGKSDEDEGDAEEVEVETPPEEEGGPAPGLPEMALALMNLTQREAARAALLADGAALLRRALQHCLADDASPVCWRGAAGAFRNVALAQAVAGQPAFFGDADVPAVHAMLRCLQSLRADAEALALLLEALVLVGTYGSAPLVAAVAAADAEVVRRLVGMEDEAVRPAAAALMGLVWPGGVAPPVAPGPPGVGSAGGDDAEELS